MICSLNEISATVRKAAVGSGFPPGVAEDIGNAASWLCAFGFDGVGAALRALESPTNPSSRPNLNGTATERTVHDVCVALTGPSIVDLLVAGPHDVSLRLVNVDSPLLLVGMTGTTAAANTNLEFRFQASDESSATLNSERAEIGGSFPPGTELSITCSSSADEYLPAPMPMGGVEVETSAWNLSVELAARTYVPASEESRLKGAGAGLTDND